MFFLCRPQDVRDILGDAKAVLVFFIVCEGLALIVAIALRYWIPNDPAAGYDQWADAEAQNQRSTQLSGARTRRLGLSLPSRRRSRVCCGG